MGQGNYIAIGWGRSLTVEELHAIKDEDGDLIGLTWQQAADLVWLDGRPCVLVTATNGVTRGEMSPPAMPLDAFPAWIAAEYADKITEAKGLWEAMRKIQPLLGEGYLMIGSDYD